MLLTGSWLHLVHLRSWCTRLHIHHRRLLVVPLLRSLVAHHWCAWPGARKSVGAGRHMGRVLGVGGSWSGRVHLHLWIARHAHEGPIGRLVCHHLATHRRAWTVHELTALWIPHGGMLNTGTHAVLRDLLRIARHGLRLCAIHVGRHRAW
jgi:hypothetical protein